MTVAVAILNYNGQHWLEKFLPSVIQNSPEAQIYVIDNASTDESLDFLSDFFPSIKVIKNNKNFGFAGGYNEGLKQIQADIYCLLNSDVEVAPNWIPPVISLFERENEIAAIQPKILDYYRPEFFEFAGAAGGLIDNLGYPYCRGRIFEHLEKDNGQYNDESQIFWATGCALFIRSKDFWQQGGFDERFFAHQEEIDLCWRLKNDGKKIFYTYKSTVYHAGGGTLRKENPRKTFLNIRNNLTMLLKNLPASNIFSVIFSRLVLDGIASFYLAYKDGWPHMLSVLRAHFSFYAQIPGTLERRGHVQLQNYWTTKWLIFKHFLKTK